MSKDFEQIEKEYKEAKKARDEYGYEELKTMLEDLNLPTLDRWTRHTIYDSLLTDLIKEKIKNKHGIGPYGKEDLLERLLKDYSDYEEDGF